MARERYERVWDPALRKHVRMHRLVAEEVLGRPLRAGEVVHHRDGDRTNNDPGNLQVLPSQRHHMVLEHVARRAARGQAALFGPDVFLGAERDRS